MFKASICRIILLTLCLNMQAAWPSSWHVLHLFTGCNHTILHTEPFFSRFMPLVVSSLKQTNSHLAKYQMPTRETIMEVEYPHKIYHYGSFAPRFSAHLMVMPNLSQVTLDIYCDAESYDREALTELGKAFFRAQKTSHRTDFIE